MLLTINQTSKATGITTSCLRIWEARYGWPQPERGGVGKYRMYKPQVVNELKKLHELMTKTGNEVSTYVYDEALHLPKVPPKRRRPEPVDATKLPTPTAEGYALQRKMIEAVDTGNKWMIEALRHEAYMLRPQDKEAVLAVLKQKGIQ